MEKKCAQQLTVLNEKSKSRHALHMFARWLSLAFFLRALWFFAKVRWKVSLANAVLYDPTVCGTHLPAPMSRTLAFFQHNATVQTTGQTVLMSLKLLLHVFLSGCSSEPSA